MKKLAFAVCLLLAVGCNSNQVSELQIVPAPKSVKMAGGALNLKGISISCDQAMDPASVEAVKQFADRLALVGGRE